MRLSLPLGACVLAAYLSGISCQAAAPVTITVRFIDARNGKPYTRWKGPFQVSFYKSDPAKGFSSEAAARANHEGTVRPVLKSGAEISFSLPDPIPRLFALDGAVLLGCGPGLFDVKEVLREGVVGKNDCRTKFARKHVKFQAKPGEIIYFVAPLSFWERLLSFPSQ